MAAQGGVNVNLRKFGMKTIPQDAVAVFIGRRRTGKSTLVRDLLFHHHPLKKLSSFTKD
jgi:GTP-binding protein EngB required for normal cell division